MMPSKKPAQTPIPSSEHSMADRVPSALTRLDEIVCRLGSHPMAALDYDGTLTPIVSHPDDADLGQPTRQVLQRLSEAMPVVVISGRSLADVRARVGLHGLFYAGSHGFEIQGPQGQRFELPEAVAMLPLLTKIELKLRYRCSHLAGVLVERKRFSVAVHVRMASQRDASAAEQITTEVGRGRSELRITRGHKVCELQPRLDWDKGCALQRILGEIARESSRPLRAFYIGDDTTDEDAFRTLIDDGIGIVVMRRSRPSWASYALRDPGEVRRFLEILCDRLPVSCD